MIYLKSIYINNFLSHEKTSIDFKENQRVLLYGASGSGKSSVIEAIIWCLYGKGRSENKNLIKRGHKTAEVVLRLVEENDSEIKIWSISRVVNENGRQSLTINDTTEFENGTIIPLAKHGIKENQDWIEKDLLKSSYVLFINSIASPQDNPDNFVKQTAGKKKDLLLEIANANDYDVYYNRARDMISTDNSAIARLEAKIEEKNHSINSQIPLSKEIDTILEEEGILSNKVVDLNKELETILIRKTENQKIIDDLNNKQADLRRLKADVISLSLKIDKKTVQLSDLKNYDLDSVKKGIDQLSKKKLELQVLDEAINSNYLLNLEYQSLMSSRPNGHDWKHDLEEIEKQMKTMAGGADLACPFCGKNNPKLEEDYNRRVSYLKEQFNEKIAKKEEEDKQLAIWEEKVSNFIKPEPQEGLKFQRNELLGIISQLEHFESDFKVIEAKDGLTKSLENDMMELSISLEENNDKIKNLELELEVLTNKIDRAIISVDSNKEVEIKKDLETINNQLYRNGQRKALSLAAKDFISLAELELKSLIDETKKARERLNSLLLIKDAFSPKGIKAVIIDYLVPTLEEKINNVLSELSDFKIQIDTQREDASGDGVVEGLFINIINAEGQMLDYSNYSGGEKMKLDYSISEALAGLSKIKFRILDETIGGLDEGMLSSFIDILNKLTDGYKQLIAISHIPQVQEIFDDKIVVKKIDGGSIIN